MMLAAMFSATMSSLNSEYNVMASVITNDIYKRLLYREASPRHLLWVGRLFTVLIGLGITCGAMCIAGLGGAFEANKLFTSILAISLAVPLLFGLLLRWPNSLSLVLAVIGGATFAMVVNFWAVCRDWLVGISGNTALDSIEPPSWEVATLATIGVSVLLFCGSGWLVRQSSERRQTIERFFEKLRTPIDRARIPSVAPAVRNRLAILFGGSFTIVGLLYVGVSLASIHHFSGKLGLAAGCACIVCGCATCLLTWQRKQKEEGVS
jgi:solute:Na+ symporter, SSS family